ncbi:MAG: hypothetical protein F4089_02545, partial [Gammaproteobacteria bacterium]|nr:hypothetical protein [Gammaproteobacteria bacterium]
MRLTTKLMLVGLPLALVLVPWVAYTVLDTMEHAFVQLQSDHQRGIAGDVAMLFHGHRELFDDLPPVPDEADLVARPIAREVWVNAQASEWGDETLVQRRFGTGDGSFTLSLGTRPGRVFAYMEITDDVRVYRNLDVLRLDNADQVRISYTGNDGEVGRVAVTLSESGDTTAYTMDAAWEFADSGGAPLNDVRGFVRETAAGYALELRLRLDMLGSREFLVISFVDEDDPVARGIRKVTTTAPSETESSDLVVVRSPELLRPLDNRGYQGMQIRVIDAQQKERAERGQFRTDDRLSPSPTGFARVQVWFDVVADKASAVLDWVRRRWADDLEAPIDSDAVTIEDQVIAAALAGESTALRRRMGEVETILAGHPIWEEQEQDADPRVVIG